MNEQGSNPAGLLGAGPTSYPVSTEPRLFHKSPILLYQFWHASVLMQLIRNFIVYKDNDLFLLFVQHMASVSKDIVSLNCEEFVQFLKEKFNFSDKVLSKFNGMTRWHE